MKNEIVLREGAGRLDAVLADELSLSRSLVKKLADEGRITVDGAPQKAGTKLRAGTRVCVELPEQKEMTAQPQDIPLDIVYQDDDVLVVNKPQGMVVHPAPGNADGTLVNALLYHAGRLSVGGGALRPGIVHRLDKDTSGLICVAKNDAAHAALSAQLQNREMEKVYLALVHGNVKNDKGTIKTLMGRNPRDRKKMAVTHNGREAVTRYNVLERFGKYTLVEFAIETGRTHQIRVHAKHIGHPVVGDALYTRLKDPFAISGQLLHAQKLGFRHPETGEWMAFTAPLPAYFEQALKRLRAEALEDGALS